MNYWKICQKKLSVEARRGRRKGRSNLCQLRHLVRVSAVERKNKFPIAQSGARRKTFSLIAWQVILFWCDVSGHWATGASWRASKRDNAAGYGINFFAPTCGRRRSSRLLSRGIIPFLSGLYLHCVLFIICLAIWLLLLSGRVRGKGKDSRCWYINYLLVVDLLFGQWQSIWSSSVRGHAQIFFYLGKYSTHILFFLVQWKRLLLGAERNNSKMLFQQYIFE